MGKPTKSARDQIVIAPTVYILFYFSFKKIFSQFGSQSYPHFSDDPVLLHSIHRKHPVPGGSRKDPALQRHTRLLQAASTLLSAVIPRHSRCWECGNLSPLRRPPPSLGVTSQLCHSIRAGQTQHWQRRDSKPRPSVRSNGEPAP